MEASEKIRSMVSGVKSILITAGAGMSVDSGLPDFRSPSGLWRMCPFLENQYLSIEDLARPDWFEEDIQQAWGFYGARWISYTQAIGHIGHSLIAKWSQQFPLAIMTSNVDELFQRSGMRKVPLWEVHGSIHTLQCGEPCHAGLWDGDVNQVTIDPETGLALNWPVCPKCGGYARPNILMFGDWTWIRTLADECKAQLEEFIQRYAGPDLLVVEIGAGDTLQTVRHYSESMVYRHQARLIRINPDPSEDLDPDHRIAVLSMTGEQGLRSLDPLLSTDTPPSN